jgi:hypothetical protein
VTQEPPPPAQVNTTVPAGLSELVMKLLAKVPAGRPASAQEVVDALRKQEHARPRPAATTASYAPAGNSRCAAAGRSRKVLLPVLGAGLAAAVVAVVMLRPSPDGTEPAGEIERTNSPERLVKPAPAQRAPVLPAEDRRPGPVISLLPLFNVEKDAVKGSWTVGPDGVTVTKDERSYLQFPYRPPSEYDFLVAFTCRAGAIQISVVVAGGGRSFSYVMDGTKNVFGLGRIGRMRADDPANPTRIARRLAPNDRHTCTVRVRKDRVVVEVDGQQTADFKTDYSSLNYPPRAWPGRDPSLLGLASLETETILHRAEVVEVTGRGVFTRPDDPAARHADAERSQSARQGFPPGP